MGKELAIAPFNYMAIGSGWVGSQAVNETGQRWMSAARTAVRLGAAGWMSEMVGQAKEIRVVISASNHNFVSGSHLHPQMLAAAGGSWPTAANTLWRIVVNPGVQLVAEFSQTQCFWFGGAINGTVIIENHGHILGRGGSYGVGRESGSAGSDAIYRESKITLDIQNYGVIAGGGGGGGGSWEDPYEERRATSGGGGAPFGPKASYTNPGSAGRNAGVGGAWGQDGFGGQSGGRGGSAGFAFAGGGNIIWTNRGDVRGRIV
ncbi:receptor-recognizing protein [Plesiomonas shigelloides]|uniref:receptor-recognizing protein n=1 Tax=Plesiomonas shigelloides TaxID=703 RepID=UPI00387F0610